MVTIIKTEKESTMNKDSKEKNRKLSEKEKQRLAEYEKSSEELKKKGYRCTELTIGIKAANIYAVLLGLPVAAVGAFLFHKVHPDTSMIPDGPKQLMLFVILMLALVVVHELIHGITWSMYAQNHWKDIDFGFMKEYMTPYCTCRCPLSKGGYIMGALMPLIILGVIPTIAAIAAGSAFWLWIGVIMIMSAGGDIMIVFNILRYRSHAAQILYIDHPTQAGSTIFEK